MKPEIVVEACGGSHRLVFTIGAVEQVAEVNDQLEEMKQGFELGRWRLREVHAILDAGFKAGEAQITSRQFIEDRGLAEAVDLAYRCIGLFFFQRDPGKNALGPAAQALAKVMQSDASGLTHS